MVENFREINKDEFMDVFKLMEVSFPPAEFRSYEEELALFNLENYNVKVIEKNGVIQAFVAEWLLGDIHFIEHFAINPESRGKGLGTEVMREYIKQTKSSIIIEVESEDSLIAKRRIGFYERIGFVLSNVEYIQPTLRSGSPDVMLRLMHYPVKISDETLYNVKQEIFKTIYKKI